jgi:hypothetical protein
MGVEEITTALLGCLITLVADCPDPLQREKLRNQLGSGFARWDDGPPGRMQ